MTTTNVTKTMVLDAIKALIAADAEITVEDVTVTGTDIQNYCDSAKAQIVKKNERARERAAEKRAEGDELTTAIRSVITDTLQSVDEITANVAIENVTKNKVIARLGQMVRAGEIMKEQFKAEDGRKLMGYHTPIAE
jgi:esterase/lipase